MVVEDVVMDVHKAYALYEYVIEYPKNGQQLTFVYYDNGAIEHEWIAQFYIAIFLYTDIGCHLVKIKRSHNSRIIILFHGMVNVYHHTLYACDFI